MNALFASSGSPADSWLPLALDLTLKGTVILLLASLAALALRRASAARRHLAWSLALYSLLALPALTLLLPAWPVSLLPQIPAGDAVEKNPATAAVDPPAIVPDSSVPLRQIKAESRPLAAPATNKPAPEPAAAPAATPALPSAAEAIPWTTGGLLVWAAGAVLTAVPLFVGLIGLWFLARRAQRIKDKSWLNLAHEVAGQLGLRGGVTLLRCVRGTMPMTWGLIRPVVLLPVDAEDWPLERRRLVLLHELAHVQRRDCLTQFLAQLACALYWFHPLAWFAAKQLRLERERACDDHVLLAGSRASDYAFILLETARSLRAGRCPSLATVAMAKPSHLEGRLLAVLDPHRNRHALSRRSLGWAFTAVAALLLPLAALRPWAGAEEPPRPAKEDKPKVAAQKQITITGQVLNPEGKAVPGAQVAVFTLPNFRAVRGEMELRFEVLGQTKADNEGRFRLKVRRIAPPNEPDLQLQNGQVLATGKSFGAGLASLDLNTAKAEVTLRLNPEKVFRGRLIDIQGHPAKGVKLSLLTLFEMKKPRPQGMMRPAQKATVWPEPWTTDANGRFEIHGFGAGQMLRLLTEDDRFAPRVLEMGSGTKEPKGGTYTLSPAEVIEGRVTYEDTGKPVAAARVSMLNNDAQTQTDKAGRYRLIPAQREQQPYVFQSVVVLPPKGEPYVGVTQEVKKTKAAVKRTINVTLPRGVQVTGRITEEGSGKAVAGAIIYYFGPAPIQANPGGRGLALGSIFTEQSDAEGKFRTTVPPGKGHLVIEGPGPDYIPRVMGTNMLFNGKPGGPRWYAHAFLPLDLKVKAGSHDVTVKLRRGITVKGQVIGPDGKPATGVQMITRLNTSARMYIKEPRAVAVPEGRFEFKGCDPEQAYPVIFLDEKNELGAVVEVGGKPADDKPLTVRLAKCGSAVARFLKAEGKPREGYWPNMEMVLAPGLPRYSQAAWEKGKLAADTVHLANLYRQTYQSSRGGRTDAKGKLHFRALVPGVTYRIWWTGKKDLEFRDFTVKPGEAVDLKDVTVPRD
jgi:beta-lactamase regulating signal transducer with metallopeptidase domain/protocatechuate 3,4-dioxygenase beta subunit